MEEKIKFPETVFLIDSDFLNHVLTDIKAYFGKQLNRELPDINLDQFITFLALDASIADGEKEIMVILTHDNNTQKLVHCNPSHFKNELNNVAFKNNLGEFQFTSISPEGVVTQEELFMNLLELICDSQDVRKIVLIPFENQYSNEVLAALENCKKEVVLFGMNKPEAIKKHQWEVLAFPLMQALGIKGDEI
ncbi:DUF6621 family protein [Bacteroides sp. 519]|uniref:DUF6621 family protein n=1 Tax=Bacteroides sp. 519 TaxID=2302937 RepID=UPI0013D842CA|nr:DUF6621 family protein [Bacteroides sp. 519]NDV57103.1 hypothetical protein [Bacteroides sp. 519]